MPFVLAIVGAILVIAAIRNTHGALGTALETDVPPYMVWAAAFFGVGAIGWIPGFRHVSRMLLALVLVVLVLSNYRQILASFTGLASATPAPTPAPTTPAASYAAATGQPLTGNTPAGQPSPASGGGLITAASPLNGMGPPSLSTVTGSGMPDLIHTIATII